MVLFPISLLRSAQNQPILVEVKNGETYNGHLVSCDSFMNVSLRDAICTAKGGDLFTRIPQVYIRGASVKSLRVPDETVNQVKDETKQLRRQQRDNRKFKARGGAQHGGKRGPAKGEKI